jgi:hypothetical protein
LFIAPLGEAMSEAAPASAEAPAVVPAVEPPADMLASAAPVEGAALSVAELVVLPSVVVLPVVLPWAVVSVVPG